MIGRAAQCGSGPGQFGTGHPALHHLLFRCGRGWACLVQYVSFRQYRVLVQGTPQWTDLVMTDAIAAIVTDIIFSI